MHNALIQIALLTVYMQQENNEIDKRYVTLIDFCSGLHDAMVTYIYSSMHLQIPTKKTHLNEIEIPRSCLL